MIETKMARVLENTIKGSRMKLVRVETGMTALGMPDTYLYGGGGIECWIELKHIQRLRDINVIPWRPGQILRQKGMADRGVAVWLLISDDETDIFYFIKGYNIQKEFTSDFLLRRTYKLHFRMLTYETFELILSAQKKN